MDGAAGDIGVPADADASEGRAEGVGVRMVAVADLGQNRNQAGARSATGKSCFHIPQKAEFLRKSILIIPLQKFAYKVFAPKKFIEF